LLSRPRVVVCLHLCQLWELGEELHELDEEVLNGLLAVLGKDDVNVKVLVDDVDHVGKEVVKSCLEEVSHLGVGWGWEWKRSRVLKGRGCCCVVSDMLDWECVNGSHNTRQRTHDIATRVVHHKYIMVT